MGNHPVNLALRFILEFIAFIFPGYWVWYTMNSWAKFPFMIFLPITIASIWGVFAVSNDPSRSGRTVIAIPGILRLLIEFLVFAFGIWTILKSGFEIFGWIFAGIVILHYFLSYDRIIWLVKRK
jgi:hypothetical protein